MALCEYHPTTAGTFHCDTCSCHLCDDCVDHSVGGEARCFVCGQSVFYQVSEDSVEPFYRRLETAFKYPLNKGALSMVVGLSMASIVLDLLPVGWLIFLIAQLSISGVALNYAFLCLTRSRDGDFTAPDLTDAISGSWSRLLQLVLLTLFLGFGLFQIATRVGPELAIMLGTAVFIALPAMIMLWAETDSFFDALNPVQVTQLIRKLGLSYAVMLAFLFIMTSSVALINSYMGAEWALLGTLLQSSVANYYTVVAFHLMGYLLYQYQDRLGFATSDQDDDAYRREETDKVALAHANLRIKRGEYERAAEVLTHALESIKPAPTALYQRLFDTLYWTGQRERLGQFADRYLQHLVGHSISHRLAPDYRRLLQFQTAFQPKDPAVRVAVAQKLFTTGEVPLTLRLLNGLHKQHPTFDQLVPAYELMLSVLESSPDHQAMVAPCRKLLAALKAKFPHQVAAPIKNEKPRFEARDLVAPETDVTPGDTPAPVAEESQEAAPEFAPIEFSPPSR